MANKDVPYSIIDVFTKSPFLGNPVAVVRDATGLSDVEMQSIATEFGFSESSFILPSNREDCAARVRIFTPTTEIPFAGHPNIGTAFVLATEDTVAGSLGSETFVLDELGGEVSVSIEYDNNLPTGARIVAPQALEILAECNTELMARCLGLQLDQLQIDRVGPCVASVGLPFAFVEVKDLDALSKIAVSIPHFQQAMSIGPETVDGFAICAYVRLDESAAEINLRSRVFSPLGIPLEDPATGSASGALAALLAPSDRSFDYQVNIAQGVEMGRASQIIVNMRADSDRPEIVGNCVTISTGVIHL
jgi:trans-2,3-dihydro-3-hydroxyanthranilate isomerase